MPRGLQRVGEQPRHAGAAASAGISMRHCKTRQPAPAAVWASRRRITSDPPRSTAQGLAQIRGVTLLCLGKLLASQARKSRQTQGSKTKGQCGLRKARILCKIPDSKPHEVRGTYIKFCPQVLRNATDRWGINKADFRNEIASCWHVFKTRNFNQFSQFLNIALFSNNFKRSLGWNWFSS